MPKMLKMITKKFSTSQNTNIQFIFVIIIVFQQYLNTMQYSKGTREVQASVVQAPQHQQLIQKRVKRNNWATLKILRLYEAKEIC